FPLLIVSPKKELDLHSQKHKILGTAKVLLSSLKSRTSEREAAAIIKVLLEEITGFSYPSLIAEPEATFSTEQYLLWKQTSELILQGTPLQYALGKAWFIDLEIKVGPGALIPRPETEELADLAHRNAEQPLRIMDVGTGTGCIPIYLARKFPQAEISALDLSENALEIARQNIEDHQVKVQLLKMDILQAAPDSFRDLDIIISNPPYIPFKEMGEMEMSVKEFEPSMALFVPDEDPLLFYKTIAQRGAKWLHPWGQLLFEVHELFANNVKACMEKEGFREVKIHLDLQGKERIVTGEAPGK
ncbi:UNVERIFIED_CONTAM: hypothetical protein GTU68_003492, partial [Idotea baltica]|nr:hypothetical protein [Idotea baltica]